VTEGAFGPAHVNVSDQRRDPDSLLNFVQKLARRYRESPELGWTGAVEILDQPHRSVLAHRSTWQDASTVALHNLGPEAVRVPLHLPDTDGTCRLIDLLEDDEHVPDDKGRVEVELDGYGWRWLRVVHPDSRRLL
jgi:hypothetical protein